MSFALAGGQDRPAVEAIELIETGSRDMAAGKLRRRANVDNINRDTGSEDFLQFLDGYSFHKE